MKKNLILYILFLLLNFSCENTKSNSQASSVDSVNEDKGKNYEYINRYAGGYTVELDNVSSNNSAEVYILKNDGTAKWMYLKNNESGGAEIESEKSGEWSATDKNITITCAGNSGPITENFKFNNGTFMIL